MFGDPILTREQLIEHCVNDLGFKRVYVFEMHVKKGRTVLKNYVLLGWETLNEAKQHLSIMKAYYKLLPGFKVLENNSKKLPYVYKFQYNDPVNGMLVVELIYSKHER